MYNLIRHSEWIDDWQMTKNNKNIPPGMMQYKVSQEVILSLLPNGTKNINCVYNKDWSFAQHTPVNLQKLTRLVSLLWVTNLEMTDRRRRRQKVCLRAGVDFVQQLKISDGSK